MTLTIPPRRTIRAHLPTVILAALACASAVALSGCGSALRYGRMVDTSRLETALSPGVSTKADVQTVLGEPRNAGGAMLPTDAHPRDMWCYYYEEGTVSDRRRLFLFVFFDGDRYDGYLWFSSIPPAPPEP